LKKNSLIRIIKRTFHFFIPPEKWRFTVIVLLAIITGLGAFVFYESNAVSYLSDKPETCINCHVMYPQYASWSHSSHGRCTNCNDCHVPHDNFFRKYFFKAKDGTRHASIFTMRGEPQVIQIKKAGKTVVQENCIRCHYDLVNMVNLVEVTANNNIDGRGKLCWDCHRETPHGTVNSLSAAPYALVKANRNIVPHWLQDYIDKQNKYSAKKK
jgi:cytochrome c nitrite reductase small subunit